MKRVLRRLGWRIPKITHQFVGRHYLVGVQQENREKRPLARPADRERVIVLLDLERAKQSKKHERPALYHTENAVSAGFFSHLSGQCQARPRPVGHHPRHCGTTSKEVDMSMGGDTRFTQRQREVVELIAAGCSNEEIGRRLGISPRTAKAHSDVLRQKLGVRKRRQIPAAYRLLTGDDPLLPDTILRGEVLRRRFDESDERGHGRSRISMR